MKRKKRIFAILLTICITLLLSLTVFAADQEVVTPTDGTAIEQMEGDASELPALEGDASELPALEDGASELPAMDGDMSGDLLDMGSISMSLGDPEIPFFQNEIVQLIMIIIAIAVFVIMTIKGSSPIVAGIIATAIVSLCGIGGFTSNMFDTFLDGVTENFGMFMILFSFGVAFGAVLFATGAGDKIGITVVDKIGSKYFVVAILIVTLLIGYAGAPPLTVMPALCFAMLKKANYPRYIAMACVGGCTAVLACLPGNMGGTNTMAAALLGTTTYAGVDVGLVSFAVGVILLFLYINHLCKDARKKNIGYDPVGEGMMGGNLRTNEEMPSFIVAIIAPILVVGSCTVFMLVFGWVALPAVAASMTIGIIYLLIACHKFLKAPILVSMRTAVDGVQSNIVGAVVVCGFGAVIANTKLFSAALDGLVGSGINPYLLAVIGTFVISALCADNTSGVTVTLQTLAPTLLASGAEAGIIHRLINITATVFDSMPHAGSVLLTLGMFGYRHKGAYKYLVFTMILIPLAYTIAGLLVALIFH